MRVRQVNPKPSPTALQRYRSSHWGIEPDVCFVQDDPDLPDHLVMMGRLQEIAVDPTFGRRGGKPVLLTFSGDELLTFDQGSPERLYNVLEPETEALVREEFWDAAPKMPAFGLGELAERTATSRVKRPRQCKRPYARGVRAKPVGIVEHVVYATHKRGDGPSSYIHALGEESGCKPILAVDQQGRLWWAGGNYHVPDAGITD